MPIPGATYPFDPTGTASTNLVQGELQILPPPNAANFVLLIPFAAPYFRSSLQVVYVPTGAVLVEGVDYYCTHYFYEATTKVGQPIYGSVTFIDRSLAGTVRFRYQTIGGDWTLSELQIIEVLSNTMLNPRTATWEQIVDLPYQFPPLGHDHDVVDMTGMTDVVQAIFAIADAITAAATGANESHLDDHDNPHEVTKAQVGLGLVQNFGIATQPEAEAGLVANKYATPASVKRYVDVNVGDALSVHIVNTSNPHNVTKAQVGLSNTPNYGIASPTEAVEGTATNKLITPALMKAVMDANSAGSVSDHIANQSNPHNVTKVQVGLSEVGNYSLATVPEMLAGTLNNKYVSPYLVRQYFLANVGNGITDHTENYNNPHNVTKAQIGLGNVPNLGIATDENAIAGNSDNGFITPRLLALVLNSLGVNGEGLVTHTSDLNNPHQVTAIQVGAYTTAQSNTLITNSRSRYEWPALTPEDADPNWTLIGSIPDSVYDNADVPPRDLVFYCTGGGRKGQIESPIYLVSCRVVDGGFRMEAVQVAGERFAGYFGWMYDGSEEVTNLYVYGPENRAGFSLLALSSPGPVLLETPVAPVTAQPAGYVIAYDTPQTTENTSTAVPGELWFGNNPHYTGVDEPGLLYQSVNVATDGTELTNAATHADAMIDAWMNWIPQSSLGLVNYNASLTDARDWGWNSTTTAVFCDNTGTTLCTLRDPELYQNYTFDVTFSSDDTGRQSIGVLAAGVRLYGRDYGIYVFRTPGGTTDDSASPGLPGGNIYRNFTICMNPFQVGAINLGSTNAGITGSGDGWDLNGNCRIQVVKSGTNLTIRTSQLNSTTLDGALDVTIDLNSLPELAIFKGPTAVGLAKFKQANVSFNVTARPGQYLPYIDYQVSSGVDTSTYHVYNGASWNAGVTLNLTRPFIKPGRILHSPLTSKLWAVRRNGAVRPLSLTV